jgi:mono/diheme cytochrome c family protein
MPSSDLHTPHVGFGHEQRRHGVKAAILLLATLAFLSVSPGAQGATQSKATAADIARGKYLVAYGDCNSCHTAGWLASDGSVPVSRWLTGSSIGFRGPWGTIYPTNLRRRFQEISEDQWLFMIRTRGGHPPMKWTNLRALTPSDQRAIYRFIHGLGTAGNPAPNDVPPELDPKTPFFNAVPQTIGH